MGECHEGSSDDDEDDDVEKIRQETARAKAKWRDGPSCFV
jgi:hypothetical protein